MYSQSTVLNGDYKFFIVPLCYSGLNLDRIKCLHDLSSKYVFIALASLFLCVNSVKTV